MREKLEKAWMKVGKFLFWALVTALCCWLTYMVFVHRHVIRAAIKGGASPRAPEGQVLRQILQEEITRENEGSPGSRADTRPGFRGFFIDKAFAKEAAPL